jgi:hypothetical protein
MLKRHCRMMLFARIGLATSILLNVVFFKWGLLISLADPLANTSSLLPAVTNASVALGVLELVAAMVLAMAASGSGVLHRLVPLLKYYLMMQLLLSAVTAANSVFWNVFAVSEICRLLVSISMLAFVEVDQDIRSTRNTAREARRAAINGRSKHFVLEK